MGRRAAPEIVRFDAAPGVEPSGKPPVRIFLGTEPMQARAERVFLWSVKTCRDPSRAYEIHLMKDLAGFRRDGWTTGFTNYRYAIPALAGSQGRAIYNDVDQIYLADPAGLFDLDMKRAGALCLDEGETSVSLIDCAAMAPHWRIEEAQAGLPRSHFLRAMAESGLWGPLPAAWNARDGEYEAGRSKCFHFTTLKTQPWRPFPEQLRYEPHPRGDVRFALERAANAARYNAFSRDRPSAAFDGLSDASRPSPESSDFEAEHRGSVGWLAGATAARSLLDCSAPSATGARAFPGLPTSPASFPQARFCAPITDRHDGVVAIGALDLLAEDDVPWALNELFGAARRFVYAAVACADETARSAGALPKAWWLLQLELAAARTPGRVWRLATLDRSGGAARMAVHTGEETLVAAD